MVKAPKLTDMHVTETNPCVCSFYMFSGCLLLLKKKSSNSDTLYCSAQMAKLGRSGCQGVVGSDDCRTHKCLFVFYPEIVPSGCYKRNHRSSDGPSVVGNRAERSNRVKPEVGKCCKVECKKKRKSKGSMKTGYGLPTGDSLGYLGYTAKPYSSLPYSGYSSKGYSSLTSGYKPSKYGAEKDTVSARVKKFKPRQGIYGQCNFFEWKT